MNFDDKKNTLNNIVDPNVEAFKNTTEIKEILDEEMAEQKINNSETTDNCIDQTNDVVDKVASDGSSDEKKASLGVKILSSMALGLIFGLAASIGFYGMQNVLGNSSCNKNSVGNVNSNVIIEAVDLMEAPDGELVSTSISTVAANAMPSVVSITNLSVQEVESFFFGTQQYESESSGSGIIIGENDAELLIVTNNHVIEGNKTLTVTFNDGESVEAVVKGSNAEMDIAVIAVRTTDMKEATLQEIKIATVGDSENLVVGEPTIAIGNALGYGQSVTSGIISALSRELDGFDTKLIQTDAAINPGNSGGALLNIKGEVIGINTAKLADNAIEGMGYAIPISEVKEIIEEMMARETREKVDDKKRGTMGIVCVDVSETAAKYYNMPSGAYINEVSEGGAADQAGISRGSIITKFDKVSVNSSTALVDMLAYYEAGETVEIEIAVPTPHGEYEKKTVMITLQSAKN
jgi:serine protease Do